jgi:RNA polymerase sigma factor (sigma-70 family)
LTQTNANQLMIKFIAGDESCFEELYSRFRKPIFFYLLTFLKSESLAEEITHDTFLKIFLKKDQYKKEFSFTTWAWRIAHNQAIDKIRKKEPLSFSQKDGADQVDDLPCESDDLAELFDSKFEKSILLQAIDSLPAQQREVVSLRLYSELELQEIAVITDKNISSIKSLFYRAQKTLKESCLEKLGEII